MAEDHIPLYPWWQLTAILIPLEVFEKDSVKQYLSQAKKVKNIYSYAEYLDLEVPEIHLERAKITHKFNPRNYEVLAEEKLKFAELKYKQLEKDMLFEDKIFIIDTCVRTLVQSTSGLRSYVKISRLEWKIRFSRNKAYKKSSDILFKALEKQNKNQDKS